MTLSTSKHMRVVSSIEWLSLGAAVALAYARGLRRTTHLSIDLPRAALNARVE